ncbi:MAG: hypothetical protein U0412_14190 [Nitrospira sp.]
MQLRTVLSILALVVFAGGPVTNADASAPATEPSETWECPQADGTSIYTNKEKAGCRSMPLKSLSVVPSLDNMPLIPRTIGVPTPPAHSFGYPEYQAGGAPSVPDWAKDWYASTNTGHGEVCGMYWEWVRLNEKTRGGFFFGSDPSYGGDLTGRNQRGASYSFYDNARYVALNRIFGTGFIPVGCQ